MRKAERTEITRRTGRTREQGESERMRGTERTSRTREQGESERMREQRENRKNKRAGRVRENEGKQREPGECRERGNVDALEWNCLCNVNMRV